MRRYAEITGRSLRDELFYRIFSSWKGVIVTEGLYSAHLAGKPSTPLVARFETQNPTRVASVLALLEAA